MVFSLFDRALLTTLNLFVLFIANVFCLVVLMLLRLILIQSCVGNLFIFEKLPLSTGSKKLRDLARLKG